MADLDPDALAAWDEEEHGYAGGGRLGVQLGVTPEMIAAYVSRKGFLPDESAVPFGNYLHEAWNDYVEGEDLTQGKLIEGALDFWRGK